MPAQLLPRIILVGCLTLWGAATKAQDAPRPPLTVMTWNTQWLNDDKPDDDDSEIGREHAAPNRTEYVERIKTFAAAIAEVAPEILALQEVENERVVRDLANALSREHALPYRVAFVQGRDTFTGQDVAFLVFEEIAFQARCFDFRPFIGRDGYKSVSKHLVIRFDYGDDRFQVITAHLSTQSTDRKNQARTLRTWIDGVRREGPLIVLGDLNVGLRFNETTPDSDIGTLRGFATDDRQDDLFDCHQLLDGQGRRTHVSGRELDRVLISSDLRDGQGYDLVDVSCRPDLAIRGRGPDEGRDVAYRLPTREQDLSDHYPMVVRFEFVSEDSE